MLSCGDELTEPSRRFVAERGCVQDFRFFFVLFGWVGEVVRRCIPTS